MSADNWAICPRCLDAATRDKDERVASVMALYGKVPFDEFDAKRAALVPLYPEACRTFREDYEFYGATKGVVEASYSGQCSKCGLSVELAASKRFWPEEKA